MLCGWMRVRLGLAPLPGCLFMAGRPAKQGLARAGRPAAARSTLYMRGEAGPGSGFFYFVSMCTAQETLPVHVHSMGSSCRSTPARAVRALQVVDFGEPGPVRCARCKAYINPFMKWLDGGRKMQCNFCGSVCDTPPDYVCHLGPDGQRRDKFERPELCKGCVGRGAAGSWQFLGRQGRASWHV